MGAILDEFLGAHGRSGGVKSESRSRNPAREMSVSALAELAGPDAAKSTLLESL